MLEVLSLLKIETKLYNAASSEYFGNTHGFLQMRKRNSDPQVHMVLQKQLHSSRWRIIGRRIIFFSFRNSI